MQAQHGVDIKGWGTDRGMEYTGGLFDKHLASKGTKRQLTPHDTPQLNGAAERLSGTLANDMRAILLASGLPNRSGDTPSSTPSGFETAPQQRKQRRNRPTKS
jgi:transposase InsO family protein